MTKVVDLSTLYVIWGTLACPRPLYELLSTYKSHLYHQTT